MKATRAQVIAYRVAAQQLDRRARTARGLAVLDIGVQEAAGEQARLAFDARLPSTPGSDLVGPEHTLALVWSLRGAPYVHRRGALDDLTGALIPLSEADARQRLNETGPSVTTAGIDALEQFATATKAMRAVVSGPIAKGAASTAVSKKLPAVMLRDCRSCQAKHISDSAMRSSALAAGIELQPDTSPPVLLRRPGTRVVTAPNTAALRQLCLAYLRILGPASMAQVADYLGVRRKDLERAWPGDLTEVTIGRSTTWLPAARAGDFANAAEPELVRLLGGFDPYLQARDRDLIVPDKTAQKALWPVLGRPGAVFVDGEVLGVWRPKASGKKLTIAVEEFAPLPAPAWRAVGAEAERVAAVRGLTLGNVTR